MSSPWPVPVVDLAVGRPTSPSPGGSTCPSGIVALSSMVEVWDAGRGRPLRPARLRPRSRGRGVGPPSRGPRLPVRPPASHLPAAGATPSGARSSPMRDRDRVPARGAAPARPRPSPRGRTVRIRTAGRSVELPFASCSITDELLWLLGLYVAEGSWQQTHPRLLHHALGRRGAPGPGGQGRRARARAPHRPLARIAVTGRPRWRCTAACCSPCSATSGSAAGASASPGGSSAFRCPASSGSSRATGRATASTAGQKLAEGDPPRVLDGLRRAQGRPHRRPRPVRPRPVGGALRDDLPRQAHR